MRMSDAVSARAWVHDRLEYEILMGNVKAGEPMVELRLAEKLGVSRTPVREALRELAQEGLLEYAPNRGMFVRGIAPKDAEDAYTIRMMLDEQAVRWAVERMTDGDRAELMDVLGEMREMAVNQAADPRMAVLDTRFHHLIYRCSGSVMLQQTMESLERFILRGRSLSLKNHDRALKAVQEHQHIASALLRGDAEDAASAMREHITRAKREVLNALRAESES